MKYGMDGIGESVEGKQRQWRCLIAVTAILLVIAIGAVLVILLAVGGVIDLGECSRKVSPQVKKTGTIRQEAFGKDNGVDVTRFTLVNKNGSELQVISYGATVTVLKVPDRDGKLTDIVLGYDNLEGYVNGTSSFGSTVGRVANRIAGGQFTLDGKTYYLDINEKWNGNTTLHGGSKGFGKVHWESRITSDNAVIFTYVSPDGDQGFPGEVTATVKYSLTDNNEMVIDFEGTTTKATPINLSHHSYFNLGGQGDRTTEDHTIAVYADRYTPMDGKAYPTGDINSVVGTVYDLLTPLALTANNMRKIPNDGFNDNFCINGTTGLKLLSRVYHPPSGRVMTVYTDQPGVQLYNAMYLGSEVGKSGVAYPKWGGLCLETQNYPDAINQPTFPDSVLRPGSVYKHRVIYKFSTEP